METASQLMLDARLLTYRDLKAQLEALPSSGSAKSSLILPEATPLPAHENIRGEPYYS